MSPFVAMEQFSQMRAQRSPCSDQRQSFGRSDGTARIGLSYSVSALPLALCLLFPYGHSVISLPVGKPLADDTLQCAFGALHVIYSQFDPVAISESELPQSPVKVLLGTVLVDADHASLEHREKTFCGVGVDLAPHIFLLLVVDGLMAGKLATDLPVIGAFVGHDVGLARDIGANHWRDVGNASAFYMEAAGRT